MYAARVSALWAEMKMQHISFWLLIFYFFVEYVRLQSTYPVLDILPWGQAALLGTLVTSFFDKSIRWVSSPVNKLFILFMIVVLLSGLLAFRPDVSWDKSNIMLGWVLVYFLTINIVNTEKKFILFLLFYFLFNLKMSQHGTLTWASRGFSFAGWGLVGAPGWFRNSGEYAIQMLIFGSLAIAYFIALKDYWKPIKRWLIFVLAATGYMAVMGASSRGAQLALAAIGIWAVLKHKNGFKGLIVIAAIAAALYTILPEGQLDRFREMGKDDDSLQRLAYWEYAIDEVIPDNPVLGVGYHNWEYYASHEVPGGLGPYMIVQRPHNIFIEGASELGIVGLLCFLLLILYAFITNARTRKIASEMDKRLLYYLAYGLDAGLVGYLVAGSFVTVLYYPFFWIQVTMIVALHNVTTIEYRERVDSQRASDN